MAINPRKISGGTEISYAFGQMGSVFLKDAGATVTSNGVAGMEEAVFCAITFLEDTVFTPNTGLVAADQNLYINSAANQSKISGSTDITTDEVFPKGVTIYGRFTQISLVSGKIIAYIGY
jgi:hypothetical protein